MSSGRIARAVAVITLVALSACAHKRELGRSCPLRLLPVDVAAVASGGTEAAGLTYRAAIQAAMRPRGGTEASNTPENLVLSGGGKWGAFGAGFMSAWPQRPSFRAVTGVSTGSLQSTFVFLGNEPVAADRAYPAALDLSLGAGDPQPGRGRRYIDDLTLAYTFSKPEVIVDVLGNEVTALRKGASADLAPLRRRLDAMIDAETLRRVGAAAGSGRRLFVGVVDMDDGRAYAVDMTDLGRRALTEPGRAEDYRQCYLDVLLAASSEPLAALPVFIGGRPGPGPFGTRMYMDAGLRNGVFLQEVLGPDGAPAAVETASFNTSVIVNNALEVDDLTRNANAKWAKQWSLLTLVGRTKELLVNQIYEFSVRRVSDFGAANGMVRVKTARGYEGFVHNGKTCEAWRKDAGGKPFWPPFMQCLIAYGRDRGAKPDWDTVTPPGRTP